MEERKKEKGEGNKERNRRKVGKKERKKERKRKRIQKVKRENYGKEGRKEENITPPPSKKVSSDSPLTEISVPRFSFTTETTSLASN